MIQVATLKEKLFSDLSNLKENLNNDLNNWEKDIAQHRSAIFISILFLSMALVFNYVASTYVDRAGEVSAPDLILDLIPAMNLSMIYVYGYIFVILLLLIYPLVRDPKDFHKVVSQFSLLILLRSFFITLTHLKAPAEAIAIDIPYFLSFLSFSNDLFFSGHTAVPFLGFLIFQKRRISRLFLAMTVILASTVLVMHVHYSIDVFAALFITLGSYTFGNWFFNKVDSHYNVTKI